MTRAPDAPDAPVRALPPTLHRVLVALVVLLAVIGPVRGIADAPAAYARPDLGAQPATPSEPGLRLTYQSPVVPSDGDFAALMEVSDAPAGSDIAVDIYDRIETREQLEASTTDRPDRELATFDVIPLAAEPLAAAVDQAAGFTINLYGNGDPRPPGAWSYHLDEAGVYPLRIRLRGPDGDLLTSVTTYLIREPADGEEVAPGRVALLADVSEPPVLDQPGADGPTAVDPALTTGLDGLLDALDGHPALPVSFRVSPDTASRMAADPDAARVTTALQGELETESSELLGSPYVDIDPAELTGADLGDELTRQRDLGLLSLATTLGEATPGTWVVERNLDPPTVAALAARGIARLVVPRTSLTGPVTSSPATVAGSTLVTTTELGLDEASADDPVLAAAQVMGRLISDTTIDENGAAVVRLDPRTLEEVETAALLANLTEPTDLLELTTVTSLFDALPPELPPGTLATPLARPLGDYPELVTAAHEQLSSYASMDPEGAADDDFQVRIARTASVDAPIERRRQAVRRIIGDLGTRFGAISTAPRDRVTLGARDARIPLSIRSELDHPVDVVVEMSASDRLDLPEERIEATLVGERTVVEIPVHTRATGDTPLTITVRTPDGRVVLTQSRFTVRSTAVSGVGVVLTLGAAGFLALWWGRHLLRSRRRRDDGGDAGPRRRRGTEGDTSGAHGEVDHEDDDVFVHDGPD